MGGRGRGFEHVKGEEENGGEEEAVEGRERGRGWGKDEGRGGVRRRKEGRGGKKKGRWRGEEMRGEEGGEENEDRRQLLTFGSKEVQY